MAVLEAYLQRCGRPLEFYTDKASHFSTTPKKNHPVRDEPVPPTQIGRALSELGIGWIAAHSPQAKGRVERSFETAQDRLVKGLRVAGAKTLAEANAYLETDYLPAWESKFTVVPACPDNAHKPLDCVAMAKSALPLDLPRLRPAHKLKSLLNDSQSPAGPAKMRISGPAPGLELTWVEWRIFAWPLEQNLPLSTT